MSDTKPTEGITSKSTTHIAADYDESDRPEGEIHREALAAVTEATGSPA